MKSYFFLILSVALLLGACGADNGNARAVGELASDRIELSAEVNEPIVEIAVAEGQPLLAGQLLLRQDATRAEARLAEAEAAVAEQQARLDELVRGPRKERIDAARASLEGATEEMSFRQSEVQRVGDIYRKGLASAEALDLAKVALDTARSNRKLREAQLREALSGTTVEELAQAEQALARMAARRDSARIDVERHTMTAPVDGILDSRLFEVGERPTPGQPVLVVLGGSQPYARVFVPEDLRAHVSAGSKALVYVDGMASALDGRVRWVSSEAAFTPYYALTERDRGRLSYRAKVDIVEQLERLPDGVPVEVEFIAPQGSE